MTEVVTQPTGNAPLLVACLCAQWCNTCCDYQSTFWQMQQEFPDVRLLWVDIEDQSELVDPVEVENFPTILISASGQPRFFGTVTPHVETLRALIARSVTSVTWRGAAEIVNLAHRLHLLQH